MNTEDNQYSYLSALGEAQTSTANVNAIVNGKRQRFESDKAADVSAHILLNGVMHKPIEETVKYIGGRTKKYVENKVTNALKTAKNKALQTYNDLKKEMNEASEGEKGAIQEKLDDALQNLKKSGADLQAKLRGEPDKDSKPDTEIPEEPEPEVAVPEAAPAIPARSQLKEKYDINNEQDLIDTENRVTARYNNLDGNAQSRSDAAFDQVKEGPTNINEQSLAQREANVQLRESTVADQEQNVATTFKDNNLQVSPSENYSPPQDIFGRLQPDRTNPSTFDDAPTAPVAPVEEDVVKTAAEKTASSTGKKLFEREALEDIGEGIADPIALFGQLLVGAITTLPSILKKQKKEPTPSTLNPSSGLNVGEVA